LESFRCSTIIRVQQVDVGLATGFRSIQKEVPVIPKMTSVLLILVLVAISSSSLLAQQESQRSVSEMRRVANAAVEKDKQVNVVLRNKNGGKKKLSGVPRLRFEAVAFEASQDSVSRDAPKRPCSHCKLDDLIPLHSAISSHMRCRTGARLVDDRAVLPGHRSEANNLL
jgi:hypothetical protein